MRRVGTLLCIALSLLWNVQTAKAAPALPTQTCALSDFRLICYEPRKAAPTQVSKATEQVLDFAMAPDGTWVLYRTDQALWMAAVEGTPTRQIDTSVAPPPVLSPYTASIAWSPDGLGIAYLTAQGVKTLYPGGQTATNADRLYTNLRWSVGGARFAAQSVDGAWTFFESQPGALKITRVFTESSDVAWLDDSAVVIAPTSGGLLRLNAAQAATPPDWYIADEYFIKLQSGQQGEVLGLHPDPGTLIGSAVSIRADGKWAALGKAKLDARLLWGPAPGEMLYYITSGTPILVDRVTGAEDMLPIRAATRVEFGSPALPEVVGVQMDADLYFLAADKNGVVQLWRLPRYGFPVIQISQSVVPVTAYSVLADKVQYTAGGVTVIVNPDGTIPDIATPDLQPTHTPRPTNTPVPYDVRVVGWSPGPTVVQRAAKDGTVSRPALFDGALISPTGKFAAGQHGTSSGQLVILEWDTGRQIAVQGITGATALRWVQ